MLFCHCAGVTEAQVAAELAAGVTTVRELSARTGLGTGCGCCLITARLLLKAPAQAGCAPGDRPAACAQRGLKTTSQTAASSTSVGSSLNRR